MITSSPYNPRIRERLTPIEATDGPTGAPCHTNHSRLRSAGAQEIIDIDIFWDHAEALEAVGLRA
jgi:hypothetical protein